MRCSMRSNTFRHLMLALGSVGVALSLGFGAGCKPAPKPRSVISMATLKDKIIGRWEKLTDSPCSRTYPPALEFQARGLYFGTKADPGDFAQWDVGTFEVVNARQMKISTANDAVITYQYTLEKDVLTFVDEEDCRFQYRRVQ